MSVDPDDGLLGWLLLPVFIVVAFFVPLLGVVVDALVLAFELCRFIWWALAGLARLSMRAIIATVEWIIAVRDSFPEAAVRADRARATAQSSHRTEEQ